VAGCSSDTATTSTGTSGSSSSTSTGLPAGEQLVVAAPANQEGFARVVAITVDPDGVPVVAYVDAPADDQAKPIIKAAVFGASGAWDDPVVVGPVDRVGVVLRMTSGSDSVVTVTAESGPGNTTYASSDGGATWTEAAPLDTGTGDPTTTSTPDGRTLHVHVVRDGAAPGIYVTVG
jgi:hypothetical protein